MTHEAKHYGNSSLAFLAGATAGITAGLLLAPRSGQETIDRLKRKAQEAQSKVQDKMNEQKDTVQQKIAQAADTAENVLSTSEGAVNDPQRKTRKNTNRLSEES